MSFEQLLARDKMREEKLRAKQSVYYKRYYKKYGRSRDPKKLVAHNAVSEAVKKGKLIRPSECSKCGTKTKPEGHHPDYNKVLEVVWLCPTCHCAVHPKGVLPKFLTRPV